MSVDLQKASFWKRISAWLLDIILLATLVVGVAWGLNALFGYDSYYNTYNDAVTRYAQAYGYDMELTAADFEAMSQQEQAEYQKRAEEVTRALNADETAVQAYNMVINLMLLTATLSILIAMLLLEFVVPLLFGNGQTLGKKVFSIALVRIDSVKLTTLQLFTRTLLGKFTIETMLPVYLIIMIMFSNIGMLGTGLLTIIMMVQIAVPLLNRDRRGLHDLLAGTVAVDFASQRIFRTPQDLINYKTKLHAEEVAHKGY